MNINITQLLDSEHNVRKLLKDTTSICIDGDGKDLNQIFSKISSFGHIQEYEFANFKVASVIGIVGHQPSGKKYTYNNCVFEEGIIKIKGQDQYIFDNVFNVHIIYSNEIPNNVNNEITSLIIRNGKNIKIEIEKGFCANLVIENIINHIKEDILLKNVIIKKQKFINSKINDINCNYSNIGDVELINTSINNMKIIGKNNSMAGVADAVNEFIFDEKSLLNNLKIENCEINKFKINCNIVSSQIKAVTIKNLVLETNIFHNYLNFLLKIFNKDNDVNKISNCIVNNLDIDAMKIKKMIISKSSLLLYNNEIKKINIQNNHNNEAIIHVKNILKFIKADNIYFSKNEFNILINAIEHLSEEHPELIKYKNEIKNEFLYRVIKNKNSYKKITLRKIFENKIKRIIFNVGYGLTNIIYLLIFFLFFYISGCFFAFNEKNMTITDSLIYTVYSYQGDEPNFKKYIYTDKKEIKVPDYYPEYNQYFYTIGLLVPFIETEQNKLFRTNNLFSDIIEYVYKILGYVFAITLFTKLKKIIFPGIKMEIDEKD